MLWYQHHQHQRKTSWFCGCVVQQDGAAGCVTAGLIRSVLGDQLFSRRASSLGSVQEAALNGFLDQVFGNAPTRLARSQSLGTPGSLYNISSHSVLPYILTCPFPPLRRKLGGLLCVSHDLTRRVSAAPSDNCLIAEGEEFKVESTWAKTVPTGEEERHVDGVYPSMFELSTLLKKNVRWT